MGRPEYETNRLGLPGGVIGHIEGQVAILLVVLVDDDARGRGIGRRLVADFEAWALGNGATEIRGSSMLAAIGFWTALGYDVAPVNHTGSAPMLKRLREPVGTDAPAMPRPL